METVRIIGFDEDIKPGSGYVALEEGVYEFVYCGYTQGNTNPKNGGESYPTGIAKLRARNLLSGEEIDTEESFTMTEKYEWKLSAFWKSLGASEHILENGSKKVKQGWNSMVGQHGVFEVIKTKDKNGKLRENGEPVFYMNKNFIEPDKAPEAIQMWKSKKPTEQTPAPAQPAQSKPSWSTGW